MKRRNKIIVGIGVLVIGGFAAAGVLGMNQSAKANSNILGPKGGQVIKVAMAEQTDIQSKVAASGMLETQEESVVYAEANNQVAQVHKKVGDAAVKGEVVISFENTTSDKLKRELEKLELQLETAQLALNQLQTASKGDLLSAQSNVASLEKMKQDNQDTITQTKSTLETTKQDLETAQTDYNVTKELTDNGLASDQELTVAKQKVTTYGDKVKQLENSIKSLEKENENIALKYESATYNLKVLLNQVEDHTKAASITMKQNEIKNIQIQKESLLEDLTKTVVNVIAPIDGVISELPVEEGQMVSVGAPLFKVINPNALLVKCEVSPYYATQLKNGLDATVKYNGSNVVEINGKITRIAPVAQTKSNGSSQTTTLPIEVSIDGDLKGLKPGLVVDVKVITEDVKDVVAVPLLATMEDKEGEIYLFIVKEDFTLEKRYVKQGASNNTFVQVSDVKQGEMVVTNPTEALDNGTIVNYINPAEKEGVNK